MLTCALLLACPHACLHAHAHRHTTHRHTGKQANTHRMPDTHDRIPTCCTTISHEATERGADMSTAKAMSVVKMFPLPCDTPCRVNLNIRLGLVCFQYGPCTKIKSGSLCRAGHRVREPPATGKHLDRTCTHNTHMNSKRNIWKRKISRNGIETHTRLSTHLSHQSYVTRLSHQSYVLATPSASVLA